MHKIAVCTFIALCFHVSCADVEFIREKRQSFLDNIFGIVDTFSTKFKQGDTPVLSDLGVNLSDSAKTKLTDNVKVYGNVAEIMTTVIDTEGFEGLLKLMGNKNIQKMMGLGGKGGGPTAAPVKTPRPPRRTTPRPPRRSTPSWTRNWRRTTKARRVTTWAPPTTDNNGGTGIDYSNY